MQFVEKGISIFVSETSWQYIEEQSAFKVDPATKALINRITSEYVTRGPSASSGITALALNKRMGKWAVRTDKVCAQIAKTPQGPLRKKDYLPEKLNRRRAKAAYGRINEIVGQFFQSIDGRFESVSTIQLAQFMQDMIILADAMTVHIARSAPKPTPRMQWWLVWITLVVLQLRKNGYSVSWRKGRRKGIRKEFVHFIVLLQKHLPADCVPRKSHESVQKGIVLAIPLTRGKPIAELNTILKRWGKGEFDLASKARSFGMSNPKMFTLARLLDRIEIQATLSSGI